MSGLKKKMADYFIHNRDVVKKKKSQPRVWSQF